MLWDNLMDVVGKRNFVVLDTETTGLEQPAEICQIGIVDYQGKTLLNTLVKTAHPIPPAAQAVHHITDDMVKDSPTWIAVRQSVLALIAHKDVIVYNATYDRKLMHWSDDAWQTGAINYKENATWHCAMEAYAEFYGDRHPYYGSWKWQSLMNACLQQGVNVVNAHDALSDALMTLNLLWGCYNRR